MFLFEVIVSGIVVGGLYALIAIGLNLQYGIARIMNLAYGEFLMTACFATFWLYTLYRIDPLLSLLFTMPVTFVANWLIYRYLIDPLVQRSRNREDLETKSILATFGMLFIVEGSALAAWSGDDRSYSYLSDPINIFGFVFATNRVIAFVVACVLAALIFAVLKYSRIGTAMRSIGVDPVASQLVAIDVRRYSAIAFGLGGALVAGAGTLISMFLSFNPAVGVEYTLRALIVVIMGGVGHIMGGLVAGLILGVAEQVGAYLVDPGLTLAINFGIFILVLLIRPKGLFGKA